ncbi:hypothetical protein DF185_06895 [Marinifilum breve]|uniref:Methylated-DNA--protein-cysteine methyltransferase n=1 Tax=Marinifilum breve TaxID=2184082 RepID=A0A2V4A558_9BACT|nr:methylated-DNA--[protein]-cysteine S-methyltransferase [Marinifilum breve]PXY02510.1 hypothetical protein DF185_06895 [Marinifilum breve]
MKYDILATSFGRVILVGNENGISQLLVDNNSKDISLSDEWKKDQTLFKDAKQQLLEYFEGKRTYFDLKLNPSGTDFQKKVWSELRKIPYGGLCTYKDIATAVGNPKASRAVGMANNKNPIPIIVPCHRVIGANRKLVGYAYGLELKQKLLQMECINKSFELLQKHYGELDWWPAESDFEMMVGAILTQNTNWKNVEKALANFNGKLSPAFVQNSSNDDLAEIIRPSGYHNQKAIKLKALCKWFKQYDFDIAKVKAMPGEQLREELLAIKGVGGETADSILVYALEKAFFVIDAYTRRIFHRIGITIPDKYDDFRLLMEDAVPKSVATYNLYHALIVEHAKAYCQKKPLCNSCPLQEICNQRI